MALELVHLNYSAQGFKIKWKIILIYELVAWVITVEIKIIWLGILVEEIWVFKVYDSCDQTLDSFNKFYLFNAWLNESSIMITPTNHHSSKQSLLSRVSIFLHTSQKRLVRVQDYTKLLRGSQWISFLITFGQLRWISIKELLRAYARKILFSWLFWVAF